MTDFVVIGGGCYGTYYVRQLHAARERGKIEWQTLMVLDRDPDCPAGKLKLPGVRVEACTWESFGPRVFEERASFEGARLVPAPIAPHIAKHWMAGVLEAHGIRTRDLPWPDAPPALPYAATTSGGTLVLSHAPGMCPVNCIEPRKCPLTRGPRVWDMPDTVAGLHAKIDRIFTFVCRHYSYGVGVIPMADVLDAFDAALHMDHKVIGVATVSGCHGLADALEVVA